MIVVFSYAGWRGLSKAHAELLSGEDLNSLSLDVVERITAAYSN